MPQFAHYIISRPRVVNDSLWSFIVEDFQTLYDHMKDTLGGSAGEGKPTIDINEDVILFNGIGDKACEDFRFRKIDHDRPFYIKTGKLPYDLAVQVGLLILKRYLPDLRIETQGTKEDWEIASHMFEALYDQETPSQLFKQEAHLLEVSAQIKDLSEEERKTLIYELKTLLIKRSDKFFIRLNGVDIE